MTHENQRRVFGDVEAALAAFEQLPVMVVVTDGPELRTVAFNAAARAITEDRLVHGVPLLEALPKELLGQGWAELYALPTRTGETASVSESRLQIHQPSGAVLEMYLDAFFVPRFDADGRPRGTILLAQDVTRRVHDRVERERELDELREHASAARGGVRAMQRALLPDAVPLLPGVDVAARYLLASDEREAGGDWFDAVGREDGSVALVVGDVVGHGQAAAVAMGQLRSVLLAQLRAGADVVEALRFVDGFATAVPAARRATVAVATIEAGGDIAYCTAGHPPPLLLTDDAATTRYLTPTGSAPLATGAVFTAGHAHLDVGEVLVLYSDGILDRPGIGAAAASLELRTTADAARRNLLMPAGAPASAVERICTLTIELLTRVGGHSDDVTVLAAQRQLAVPRLDLELEVGPDAAGRARHALRGWLSAFDPSPADQRALLAATTELVANVNDHAYLGAEPEPFRLSARLGGDSRVEVQVVDRGHWKLPVVTSERGLGLALVRRSVDELALDPSPQGTTATIRRTVARSAGLMVGPTTRPEPDPERFDVWSTDGPEPSVTVTGPLDASHVPEVAGYLELALTEAARTVVVDLAAVTTLASAAVDLLFRIIEEAGALDLELSLIAPNGSPAQQTLALVRLPYRQPPSDG